MSGKRVSQNMISALSNGGQLHFSVYEGRFTASLFIAFLDRLIRSYPNRKIFLVCDNHSTHHAKTVKQWVSERLSGSSFASGRPTAPSRTRTSTSTGMSNGICVSCTLGRRTSQA